MAGVLEEHMEQLNGPTVDAILGTFRPIVWAWFHAHEDDVLFRKWIFAIRIRDVRVLVELIVGPEQQ